jgi:ribosomal subunit interface protein
MADQPTVVATFKDMPVDEELRESIEARCAEIGREFHEVTRIEVTIAEDGVGYTVHGHVTGKGIDVGAQAQASETGPAADRLLDKVERQLRTLHDKRIFIQRREAQRHPPKKRNSRS